MPELFLNGVPFAFVATVACERDENGRVAVETPARTYSNPKNRPLNAYGRGPFARLALPTDERRPGVFAVTIDGRVVYVAKTVTSLEAAFGRAGIGRIEPRACFEARDAARCRVNGEIAQALMRGNDASVYFHPTAHAADLERSLVATLATAMHPSVASAIREMRLAGRGIHEIAEHLAVREAFVYRIVAKMDKHRSDWIADAG